MTALLRFLIRDYDNKDNPQVRSRCGKLAGVVGIAGTVLLFCAKLVVGILSNSVSVMADALNNLMDASSSIVTLIGFRLSEKPADKHHPFGHARIEYLSGLAVSMLIFLMGFELAKSSFAKIRNPEPVEFSILVALILCTASLVDASYNPFLYFRF